MSKHQKENVQIIDDMIQYLVILNNSKIFYKHCVGLY
jgi:hypothetical protein